MINFVFTFKSNSPLIIPEEYPEVLKYEGNFSIEIDNKVFFHEADFSIFEFLLYTDKWKTLDCDMLYDCIDTDDNPLISFIKNGELFYVNSPWSLFECKQGFTKKELLEKIDNMKSNIIEQCY